MIDHQLGTMYVFFFNFPNIQNPNQYTYFHKGCPTRLFMNSLDQVITSKKKSDSDFMIKNHTNTFSSLKKISKPINLFSDGFL